MQDQENNTKGLTAAFFATVIIATIGTFLSAFLISLEYNYGVGCYELECRAVPMVLYSFSLISICFLFPAKFFAFAKSNKFTMSLFWVMVGIYFILLAIFVSASASFRAGGVLNSKVRGTTLECKMSNYSDFCYINLAKSLNDIKYCSYSKTLSTECFHYFNFGPGSWQ